MVEFFSPSQTVFTNRLDSLRSSFFQRVDQPVESEIRPAKKPHFITPAAEFGRPSAAAAPTRPSAAEFGRLAAAEHSRPAAEPEVEEDRLAGVWKRSSAMLQRIPAPRNTPQAIRAPSILRRMDESMEEEPAKSPVPIESAFPKHELNPVPFEASLMLNRSHFHLDAGLFHGRQYRVGFGPNLTIAIQSKGGSFSSDGDGWGGRGEEWTGVEGNHYTFICHSN